MARAGVSPPIPLDEAQARLLEIAAPLPVCWMPAEEAVGHYLAEPLHARRTQPPADLSSMDGYAVAGSAPWQVIGESRCGAPFAGALRSGEAIRISTGAWMPEGADKVLLQENAIREGDRLAHTSDEPAPGSYIRRAGFDFREGDRLLGTGTRIGPAQLALALAGGHGALPVHRKARVAIMDCGDELAADPTNCDPFQLPASNGAMMAAMARSLPCEILRIGPVADDRDALARALARVENCDLLVTSGGASVGDHDLVQAALEAWGAKIDFWRVAIKPGKPLMVAQRGAQMVLGLPGNPVSSFVTSFLFVLPMLRRMSGAKFTLPLLEPALLGGRLPATGSREEFLRAYFTRDGVLALDEQDSSALQALASAEALIRRSPNSPALNAGEHVEVLRLLNGGIA